MPIYRVTVDYGYQTLHEFGVEAKDLCEARAVGAKYAGRMLIVEAHDDVQDRSEEELDYGVIRRPDLEEARWRYEVRLDEETGEFGVWDLDEGRYSGHFGRGEDARSDARRHADRMNESGIWQ